MGRGDGRSGFEDERKNKERKSGKGGRKEGLLNKSEWKKGKK